MPKLPALKKWLIATAKQYAWAPTLMFTIHMIVMTQTSFYDNLVGIDKPIHFLGGFVIAYFWNGAYLVAKKQKFLGRPSVLLQNILVFFAASTSTILWEFHEFLADKYLGTTMQASVADTMGDMFLGMLGAVVLLFVIKSKK